MQNINSAKTIAAAAIMSAAGSAVFLLLPVLIGVLIDDAGFNEAQAGLLSSIYFAGYMVLAISAFFWIRRAEWQLAAKVAYLLLTSGLVLASFTQNYTSLAIFFFISGAGAGILFGLGVTIISDTDHVDRNFGWVLAVQQLVAAILFFSLPIWVIVPYGLSGVLLSVAAVMLLLSISSQWVPPKQNLQTQHTDDRATLKSLLPVRLGLIALIVHFAALSAVWAFVERLGISNNIPAIQIGTALAIAMVGGLLGGVAAALQGDSFGQRLPLFISTIIFVYCCYIFSTSLEWLVFALSSASFSFMWNYVLAYQMGILASNDHDGRHAVLMPAAQAIGAVLGPAFGGAILSASGYGQLLLIAAIMLVLAITVFIYLVSQKNIHHSVTSTMV